MYGQWHFGLHDSTNSSLCKINTILISYTKSDSHALNMYLFVPFQDKYTRMPSIVCLCAVKSVPEYMLFQKTLLKATTRWYLPVSFPGKV